jgi:hypothetical protein
VWLPNKFKCRIRLVVVEVVGLLDNEPVLNLSIGRGIDGLGGLNLDGLGLVLGEFSSNVALNGGSSGSSRSRPGLDRASGVSSRESSGLEGLDFLDVEVLDEVGTSDSSERDVTTSDNGGATLDTLLAQKKVTIMKIIILEGGTPILY